MQSLQEYDHCQNTIIVRIQSLQEYDHCKNTIIVRIQSFQTYYFSSMGLQMIHQTYFHPYLDFPKSVCF